MHLTHREIETAGMGPVAFTELAVLQALGVRLLVFLPLSMRVTPSRVSSRWTVAQSGSGRDGGATGATGNNRASRVDSSRSSGSGQETPWPRAAARYLLTTPWDNCKARAICR